MGTQFFVRYRGKITGPFTDEAVRSHVRSGFFTTLHELSDDKRSWVPISLHPSLLDSTSAEAPDVGEQSSDRLKSPTNTKSSAHVTPSDGDTKLITKTIATKLVPPHSVRGSSNIADASDSGLRDLAKAANAIKSPVQTDRIQPPHRQWHARRIAIGTGLLILATILALFVLWPKDPWEQNNAAVIISLQADLPGLAAHSRYIEIAERAQPLLAGNSQHSIRRADIRDALIDIQLAAQDAQNAIEVLGLRPILASEREAMGRENQREYAQAIPMLNQTLEHLRTLSPANPELQRLAKRIQNEIGQCQQGVEQLAREEQQRRVEEARKAAETAAQHKAEAERQAELARRQQEREEEQCRLAAQTARALRVGQIKLSPAYTALSKEADSIVSDLDTSLIGEDSAWRSISRRSRAARDLLAIHVKLQGDRYGIETTKDVDELLRQSSVEMIGEDSALREIYKYDDSFFKILGIWCKTMDKDYPGTADAWTKIDLDVSRQMIGEDSAYRGQSAYAKANMLALEEVVKRLGLGRQAQSVTGDVILSNAGDDSAIRGAMRDAEGSMQLLLLLVEQDDAETARRLRRSASLNTISDDSAIRAHSEYKDAMVRAIRELIRNP